MRRLIDMHTWRRKQRVGHFIFQFRLPIYIYSFFLPGGGHRLSITLWKTEIKTLASSISATKRYLSAFPAFPIDRIWAIAKTH